MFYKVRITHCWSHAHITWWMLSNTPGALNPPISQLIIVFDQSQISLQTQLSAGSQALLKDALSRMTNSNLISVFGLLLILSSSSPFHSAELAKAGLAAHFILMYEHDNCKEYCSFLKNHLVFPEKSFSNLARPAHVRKH